MVMPEAEEISSSGPAQKPASSFSIFGRTLALPFARPALSHHLQRRACPLSMALSHFYSGWTVIGELIAAPTLASDIESLIFD
jgi:hypothetical protein